MKNKRNNYTLTEILVVIIILAVVMAIALPGFNNLVNGNKTMRAAKQLATAFQQARAEAIVSGCKVALLLPCRRPDNTTSNTSNIRSNYSNGAYGIVVYDKDGFLDLGSERNADFKWQRLPSGVIISLICEESNYTPGTSGAGTSSYFSSNSSMNDIFSSSSTRIDIEPWFNETNGSSSNRLRSIPELENFSHSDNILQSETRALGVKLRREYSRFVTSTANTSNCVVPVVIFKPDGTTENTYNINVFVTEGFVDSNGSLHATRPNTNTSATNYQTRPFNSSGFLYNRFTGRVRYYEDAYL